MSGDLASRVHDNYVAAFRSLATNQPGGAVERFGSITVPSSGFPSPMYNQAFVFEPAPDDAVQNAVEWLRCREVPFWVTATDHTRPTVDAIARSLDIERVGETPGMLRPSLSDIPTADSDAEIGKVVDEQQLPEFVTVAAGVFGTSEDIARRVYRPALEAENIQLVLARIEGDPVACGMLFKTGAVAGIYTMAVVESARRKGIGKAVACELLRAGRESGCKVAALQSSDMAQPLYDELGFDTVAAYHHFEPVD